MKNPLFLDWDNSGSVDPTDIATSYAIAQEEGPLADSPAHDPGKAKSATTASGCLTCIMLAVASALAVICIVTTL